MSKRIEEIDQNFKLQTVNKPDARLYDVRKTPFVLYGHCAAESGDLFRRMPQDTAKAISSPLAWLNTNTAGIRVRFQTDSPYVIIRADRPDPCVMNHMTMEGITGFDLYTDDTFAGSFLPPHIGNSSNCQYPDVYEGIVELGKAKLRNITLNFPLYTNVKSLYIGLQKDAVVKEDRKYAVEKPVVYYGSSITQGGCASRPGNSYQAVISRRLNCNYINLGFSGNAKGEPEMAKYIASLPMSVFVLDYDHNAPSVEHLANTHKAFYEIIRHAQPNLPIIMATSPNARKEDGFMQKRRDVIYETYRYAKEHGDENVWFIDGGDIMYEKDAEMMTVDGIHPNDFGFYCMAEIIGAAVKEALNRV